MLTMDTYSSTDVVRQTGLTYRILDYWCRTGVIIPDNEGRGSGSRRSFSAEQMQHLEVMARVHRYLSEYVGEYAVATDTMHALRLCLEEGRVWLLGARVDENGDLEIGVRI